jgi:hypothetical protein
MANCKAVAESLRLVLENELDSLKKFCNFNKEKLTYEQFENLCIDFLDKNKQKYYKNKYISIDYSKNNLKCFREFDKSLIWQRWFIDDEYNSQSKDLEDTSKYPETISSLTEFLNEQFPELSLIQYKKIIENCIKDSCADEDDPYSRFSYKILYLEFDKLYQLLIKLKVI